MQCIAVATSLSEQDLAGETPTAIRMHIGDISVEDLLSLSSISERRASHKGTSSSNSTHGQVMIQLESSGLSQYKGHSFHLVDDFFPLILLVWSICHTMTLVVLDTSVSCSQKEFNLENR